MSAQQFRSDAHPPSSYCLATCYCGEHAHYQPMRAPSITVTAADTRQAASWADRDEPTWLDR